MKRSKRPLLVLENISVRYQDDLLFRDLNFQVNRGEHWAIVGESGAGKSTLLQTIAGKFNVVRGEIKHYYFEDFIQQHPVDSLFTYHKLIARVTPQHDFRNLSHTTSFYYQQRYNAQDSEDAQMVGEYLQDIRKDTGKTFPGDVALYWTYDRVTRKLALGHLTGKQLIKLSNGETRRLMIAAALLKNPQILLLDNPMAGLDKQTRLQFDDIIHAITRSGITVIMATSPYEIPKAITHVTILKDRKILERVPRQSFNPAATDAAAVNLPDVQLLNALQEKGVNGVKKPFNVLVRMENITVRYGKNLILDNVNWCIRPGEHWALSGPNGSGKSTLLSLINGDNPQAYANRITLFDRERGSGESIWDIKKKIGFVSPELHQYFPLENTCEQVVESGFYDTQGLFRKSDPENRDKVRRWMDFLGVGADAGKTFKDISSGRQRLCLLARALVKNPPLLILDEPCQGLDRTQQGYFRHVIDMICRTGSTTLIYVTHYQEEHPDCIEKELRLQNGYAVPAV